MSREIRSEIAKVNMTEAIAAETSGMRSANGRALGNAVMTDQLALEGSERMTATGREAVIGRRATATLIEVIVAKESGRRTANGSSGLGTAILLGIVAKASGTTVAVGRRPGTATMSRVIAAMISGARVAIGRKPGIAIMTDPLAITSEHAALQKS